MLQCEHEKKQRADQCADTRDDDDRAPVEAVSDQTCRYREEQLRQECNQAHESEIEGLMTNGVDLPRDRRIGNAFGKPSALTSGKVREELALC